MLKRMNKLLIDELLARQVAATVLADVRTVRRVIRGEWVRGLVGARIRAELERRRRVLASKQPSPKP